MCLRWVFGSVFTFRGEDVEGRQGGGGEVADVVGVLDVLQVFVANPKKPPQIEAILRRNKEKLLVFLKGFHNDKDDEQFTVCFFFFVLFLRCMCVVVGLVADRFGVGREAVPYRADTATVASWKPRHRSFLVVGSSAIRRMYNRAHKQLGQHCRRRSACSPRT